jgi:3-dehydrosphinganine reductase
MDLNYWSHADMAFAVLKEWLKPESILAGKERHLVFTSSAAAFWGIAGYGAYSPAKAAIKSLADTLFQEAQLYSADVKIHTVFPGTIDSPGLVEEEKTKPEITKILEADDPIQSEETVASKSIKGLENGEFLVVVNWLTYAMRACAWGGSVRNNWFLDTITTFITAIVWIFISPDLNGKVKKYAKEHGHPSTWEKTV